MNRVPPEPQAEGIHNATRTTLHKGAKFDYVESAWTSHGQRHTRQFVKHPGSVVILPILGGPPVRSGDPPQLVFIRNVRHALSKEIWELPAGTRDREESVELCARRELIEETGYEAASLTKLGEIYTGPGLTDELMHCFAATGLVHVGQRPEEDESMSVHVLSIAEALHLADSNELMDAKSLATLLLAQRRGLIPRA